MSVKKAFLASAISSVFLVGCGGSGGGGNAVDNEEPVVANQAPTAAIAAPEGAQTFGFIETVLDGSISSDSDGSIVSYQWLQTSGEAVSAEDFNQPQLRFKAPNKAMTLAFQLTVTDDKGATAQSTVSLENQPYFLDVASGRNHNCALMQDGNGKGVYCWGDNTSGQLNVPEMSNPTAIYSTFNTSCALADEGFKCWGDRVDGELAVPDLVNLVDVDVGWWHMCALDENGVQCWGNNYYGQLDVPELSNPTRVFAGGRNSCALDDNGLTCWGRESAINWEKPDLPGIRDVFLSRYYACATYDGGLSCWGERWPAGDQGELLRLSVAPESIIEVAVEDKAACVLTQTAEGMNKVNCYDIAGEAKQSLLDVPSFDEPTQITAKSDMACAIDNSGIRCWGGYFNGQTEPPTIEDVSQLTSGFSHSCVVGAKDGFESQLNCWGDNQLNGYEIPSLSNVISVSANDQLTCAIDDNGARCWGIDPEDFVTSPNFPFPEQPKELTLPSMENVQAIEPGFQSICAIADGAVACWGDPYNSYGQLDVPQLTNPTLLASGDTFHCAVADEGLKCWGSYWGLDFDVAMPELSEVTSLSAEDGFACAIAQGQVHCWGSGSDSIFAVPELSNPTKVVAGPTAACALDSNGVSCWGLNTRGELSIPGLSNPTDITIGYGYACANDDSGLVCWGWQGFGNNPIPTREQVLAELAENPELSAKKVTQTAEHQVMPNKPSDKKSLMMPLM